MKMDNRFLEKICTIEKTYGNVKIFDCDGKEVAQICDGGRKRQYNRNINSAYRKKRSKFNNILSTVWILDADGEVLQIGRSKNVESMLANDINPDTNVILQQIPNDKYGELLKKYKCLTFFEVKIDEYIEEDSKMYSILKKESSDLSNEHLKKAYYSFKAAYVEGELASRLEDNSMWHPSGGIDGDIFNYFKDR